MQRWEYFANVKCDSTLRLCLEERIVPRFGPDPAPIRRRGLAPLRL